MDFDSQELARQLGFARAINRLARIITRGCDAQEIRESMAEIIGETLAVDRALIYDIRFDDQVADGLCEWLNPAAQQIEPTIASYPLSIFIGGAEHVKETHETIQSHRDEPHPALLSDGSADILHRQMQIESLLWHPFDFEDNRFLLLVFNQVRHRRTWSDNDLAFIEDAAEMVSMAHLRDRLEAIQRREEQRAAQRTRLEGLGLLAGGVAHDFNNLLTGILGHAALAQNSLHGPPNSHVRQIQEAANTAAEMCRQLLTYAGRAQAEMAYVDLNVLAKQVVHLDAAAATQPTLELADQHVWVLGDRSQLHRVLLNLLNNAFDATTADGHVSVRIKRLAADEALAEGIRLPQPEQAQTYAIIEVEDSGVGMDNQTLQRIFEPFFTSKTAGHGLGLALVHGALERHGAAIDVKSSPGQGSTFTLVFPLTEVPSAPLPLSPSQPSLEGSPKTVLVVDDEPIVRVVCKAGLCLAGFQVEIARSGDEASEVLARRDPIDLIVMDVQMPGRDGRQVFATLREQGYNQPIILISANPLVGPPDYAEQSSWMFLQKPFLPNELVAAVGRLLHESISQ
jgi:signal transduction histidine kinase